MLDVAAPIIQPSVTTNEIDRVIHLATIAAGANFNVFLFQNTYISLTSFLFIEF